MDIHLPELLTYWSTLLSFLDIHLPVQMLVIEYASYIKVCAVPAICPCSYNKSKLLYQQYWEKVVHHPLQTFHTHHNHHLQSINVGMYNREDVDIMTQIVLWLYPTKLGYQRGGLILSDKHHIALMIHKNCL